MASTVHSQDLIQKGKITSLPSGLAVSDATVVAYRVTEKDSIITSYTQTNLDGFFELNLESATQLLRISRLGIKETFVFSDILQNPLVIQVPTSEVSLQEVIVQAERPLRIRSDTTIYKIDKFKEGNERNIEDVLKKLPGVEVSDNGTITFNGKAISKILIEGDDFFSKDYQILSKNIRPEIIDEIEAIENFNDNKLMRGIKKSNQVVLNLSLSEDLKTSFFGNISGGGGLTDRFSASHNLFSLSSKLKVGYIGNLNNISENSMAQTTDNFSRTKEGVDQNLPLFLVPSMNLPIDFEDIYIPNIGEERYLDTQSLLQALQINYDFSEKTSISTYGYFHTKKYETNYSDAVTFLGNTNSISIQEDYSLKAEEIRGYGRSNLSYEPNDKSLFLLNAELSSRKPEGDNQIQISATDTDLEKIISKNLDNYFSEAYDLSYANKLSANSLLQLFTGYTNNDLAQELSLNGARYQSIFASNGPRQSIDIQRSTFSIGGNYIINKEKNNLEGSLNFSQKKASFFSSNISLNGLNAQNTYQYDQDNYRAGIIHTYTPNRKMQIQTKVSGTRANFRIPEASDSDKTYFFLDPSFRFTFNNRKGQRILWSIGLQNDVAGVSDLYESPIISNYRNIINKSTALNVSKNVNSVLRYSIFNNRSFSKIVMGGSYDFISSPFAYAFDVQDNLNTLTLLPSQEGTHQFNGYVDVNKLFHPIRSRLGLRGNYSYSEIQRLLSDESNLKQATETIGGGAYLYTAFKGPVNFKMEYNYSTAIVLENDLSERFATDNTRIKISALWKPIKNMNSVLSYERITWPNVTSDFLDMTVSYVPPKYPQFAARLVLRNILNADNLAFDNFSNSYIQRNQFNLVPRILFAEITYSLGTGKKTATDD